MRGSTALARGKNDKVDAERIALYATKNLDRLRLWKPMETTLEKNKASGNIARAVSGYSQDEDISLPHLVQVLG